MAAAQNILVQIPEDVAGQIRQAVESGEYATSAEAIQDALAAWSRRRTHPEDIARLSTLYQQALADERPALAPDAVFTELENRYRDMA